MSNTKYQNCNVCNAVYLNESSNKCHYCNLTKSTKKQFSCTAHLSADDKKKIAVFIANNRGKIFKSYNKSMPFIKDHLGLDINFKGVRSIISSEFYKSIAF
jgi:hypothetical protein